MKAARVSAQTLSAPSYSARSDTPSAAGLGGRKPRFGRQVGASCLEEIEHDAAETDRICVRLACVYIHIQTYIHAYTHTDTCHVLMSMYVIITIYSNFHMHMRYIHTCISGMTLAKSMPNTTPSKAAVLACCSCMPGSTAPHSRGCCIPSVESTRMLQLLPPKAHDLLWALRQALQMKNRACFLHAPKSA